MSRLSKLIAKPIEINIGGELLSIHPLSVSDYDLVADLNNPDKQQEAIKKIIIKTLQRAVPEATEEEINNISLDHVKELTQAIMAVNGFNDKG